MNCIQKNYFILTFLILLFIPEIINAQKAYFNLSEEVIKIETDFKGKEVIIFGLTDYNYDTILILKGPNKDAKLSIKERLFGIWIETKKFNYKKIPSIFFVASTTPGDQILDESVIRNNGLNFNNFDNNDLNNK